MGLIVVASLILPACAGIIGMIFDSDVLQDDAFKTFASILVIWMLFFLAAATSYLVFGVTIL
jgi:hypothetical protein